MNQLKLIKYVFGFIFLIIVLAACSNTSESTEDRDMDMGGSEGEIAEEANDGRNNFDHADKGSGSGAGDSADGGGSETLPEDFDYSEENRKIIYTAYLYIEVKDYDLSLKDITTQVAKYGGYLVESTMSDGSSDGSTYGEVTVRVPQEKFQVFLDEVQKGSNKVIDSSITGQDVTEEFVDLESRLKSKRTVETRLLSFMEQAEKTEDLLAISKDLAAVQEEIETIVGRMNYLQNRSDLATITISIQEKNVTISTLGEDELNTWEQTQEQFKKSINFLLNVLSFIFVFFIGNIPVIIVLGVIGLIAFFVIRKRIQKQQE